MSGQSFQIPGLGQARPNERLPADNFAPDLLVAAASIVGQDVLALDSADPAQLLQLTKPKANEPKDENAMDVDSKQSDHTSAKPQEDVSMADNGDNKQQTATENSTASNLDSPPSPDVTSTLEAALNGMLDAPASLATMVNAEQDGAQEEEQPEWEEDSSPYESDSDSDSSSDDDSDDDHPVLGVEETVKMLMAGLDDEEEDGPNKGKGAGAPLRTKNEIVEEVIPKPDVVITPEMKIEPLAHVEFIVENTVVMKSRVPGEVKVLDLGAVLCKEDRTVIGALADIIGNVKSPLYTCIFASQDEIKELGLEVGTHIFYSVDHANYVLTQELKKQKGTDASNLHDEEVGADEMEFSDDEKEAEYKRQRKHKKNGAKAARGGLREQVLRDKSFASNGAYAHSEASSATLGRTPAGSVASLNYDEDDDGPYRPLARPVGFGQGVPPSLPPKPEVGFNTAHGGQGQRGGFRGGRGEFRGRGQRGGYRGADRKPGGHRGGRGGAAGPSYGGHDSPSTSQFNNTQLPPPIPPTVQLPAPFGATPGSAPPMPGGQWPHIPIPFPPPPISYPQPSTGSPVPPPQLAGAFNFNFQAWNQAQSQAYQYPQQSSSSSAPAPQQQSSTPSYPQAPAVLPPAWPGVPPPPPIAGAYVNPAFFQQLQQAQQAQQAQAQQAQQSQQPQQPQQQQQYWGQHNAYGQAPK